MNIMSDSTPKSRLVDPDRPADPIENRDVSKFDGETLHPQQTHGVLPPNLQGKSPEEIAEDYRKLQSERGRLGNEVGQLRKQLEQLMQEREQPQKDSQPEPDYWSDPESAVKHQLEPLQRQMQEMRAEKLRAELRAHHPDYQEVVGRDEFREWVMEKKSRTLLAQQGDAGDVESARELLDLYKEAMATGNATPQEAVRRDRTARASSSERGSGRRPTGTVYKRGELQNLRAYNRRRYEELLPDIRRAYAEGRVID